MQPNNSPALTRELVAQGIFRAEPFYLVDVGASGGIDSQWNVFGDSLRAVGFDPLVREMSRLNAAEKNPGIRYQAALVGCRGYEDLLPKGGVPSNDAIMRSSSVRVRELLQRDYAKTYYDQTHDGSLTSEFVELDEYFLQTHPANVDFIKTDTDGHDIEVLKGARELLVQAPVMGIMLEANFLGPLHESTNLFSNVDIYLRNLGFSLFDLAGYRYSRALLPKRFRNRLPAQTLEGQMAWGDFLYFRDAGIDRYEETWKVFLSAPKLLKLCCLYEMFSFQDCAAEIFVRYHDRLSPLVDVQRCLDLLTPPLPNGRQVSYREYIDFFEKDPEAFYPKR